MNKIINQKQKDFFKVLFECGELLFQSEKKGSYSADMVKGSLAQGRKKK